MARWLKGTWRCRGKIIKGLYRYSRFTHTTYIRPETPFPDYDHFQIEVPGDDPSFDRWKFEKGHAKTTTK